MSRVCLLFLAGLVCSSPASAASCAQMVGGLESYLAEHPDQAGTRRQTVAAQLQHQPTPGSVAAAKMESRDNLVALLAEAKHEQSAGDEGRCRRTLGYIEWMLKH